MALTVGVVAAVGAVLVPMGTASAAPVREGCKDVYFVGSRGSGEHLEDGPNAWTTVKKGDPRYGMGARVQRVYNEWRPTVRKDATVGVIYNTYTAASVDLLKPSNKVKGEFAAAFAGALLPPGRPVAAGLAYKAASDYWYDGASKFVASADLGRGVLVTILTNTHRSCPNAKFVLAGYSQGAMATHQAMEDLIESPVFDAIAGVFLVADGDRYQSDQSGAQMFGSALRTSTGVRAYLGGILPFVKPRPESLAGGVMVADICDKTDIVCDFNPYTVIHHAEAGRIHGAYQDRGNPAITKAVNALKDGINRRLR